MTLTSVHPAERLRGNAEPSGTTDLNVLLAGLLATSPEPVALRCDKLPPAAGAEEEWWLLLQWLLQPLKRQPADSRYVHVQCQEDPSGRNQRYVLSLRCNSTERCTPAGLGNPQLAALAERLGVQLLPPAPADTHCLFMLQFAGK